MGLEEDITNARLDVAEMKGFVDASKRPKVQSALTIELRRQETHLANLLDKQQKSGAAQNGGDSSVAAPAVAKPTAATTQKAYDVPYKNYSWDQSDKFVKFYLTSLSGVKELASESFVQELTQDSARLKICNLKGKNHIFEIIQLAHKIVPEKSHFKVKTDMVTVFLAKAVEGQHWSHATAASKAKADKQSAAMKMDDPAGADKAGADPTKGIMDMMKKMYDEGDDDMKRTIAKAWTESRDKKAPGGLPGGLDLPDL